MTSATNGMSLSVFQTVLRVIAEALKTPVIIILIVLIAFSVFSIGWIIVEAVTERKGMNVSMPSLLDRMKKGEESLETCIKGSGLLMRQKTLLLELLKHPDFSKEMILDLSDNLFEKEESHYDLILKTTQLVSKIAPMAGLLGTLIPLGPGIIALGQGDTYTLSESMLTAFDTTIAGLISAAVCLVISTIRKRWYDGYLSDLETLIDCVIELREEQKENRSEELRNDSRSRSAEPDHDKTYQAATARDGRAEEQKPETEPVWKGIDI